MIVPNPDYRPDPDRCVHVQGEINQAMVDRLVPQILKLQKAARAPVTVYIDSPGGSTDHAGALRRILAAPDQDGTPACRLITVATVFAASAAADLLSSGDYAVAYPGSTLYYHGTRTLSSDPLTEQGASFLTRYLQGANDKYAMDLAKRSIGRFVFQYALMRPRFKEYRASLSGPVDTWNATWAY